MHRLFKWSKPRGAKKTPAPIPEEKPAPAPEETPAPLPKKKATPPKDTEIE